MKDLFNLFVSLLVGLLCVSLCVMIGVTLGSVIGGDPSPGVGVGGILGVLGGIFLGRKVVGLFFLREGKELKMKPKENQIRNKGIQRSGFEKQCTQKKENANIEKEKMQVTDASRLQAEIGELLSNGEFIHPGYFSFSLMERGLRMADMQVSPNGIYFIMRYICSDGSVFGIVQTENKVIAVKECYPDGYEFQEGEVGF